MKKVYVVVNWSTEEIVGVYQDSDSAERIVDSFPDVAENFGLIAEPSYLLESEEIKV